jgi:predicted nucleic acid-binding protein
MNGISYLADTNCFIYLLDEHPLLLPFAQSRWAYSFITEMEILSKKGIILKHDAVIRQMLASCTKAGHNQAITDLTIKLRRKYSLKLPDAIIAATAQALDIPLLTADKGFAPIKEIDCFILELYK